nr:sugar phosphate isomerase/epimerase [uncultured Brevundimonas sp.]
MVSRRGFLAMAGAAPVILATTGGMAEAVTAAPPADLGVQLWMVRHSMAADFAATLKALADLGVRKVELAGAPDLSGADLRRAFDNAGLACVSGHLPVLQMTDVEVERRIAYGLEVGMTTIATPMPGFAALLDVAREDRLAALMAHRFTADDWRWNADRLNALGERAKAAGLALAYHNHNIEFADLGGQTAMDLLLERVDPAQAHFQFDVGNAVLGGVDPFDLLIRHPGRFRSAHLKDWRAPIQTTTRPASPPSAAFGEGVIDWARWRRASAEAGIAISFIERENMPAGEEVAAAAQALQYFTLLQGHRA